MSEPRAFVAGATGYVGQALVRELCARAVATVAHVRPDSTRLDSFRATFSGLGAEVDTSPWQPEAFLAGLARLQPSHVFALLGTTRSRANALAARGEDARDASYEAIDYGLTHVLLEAARALPVPPVFVYLSALGVRPGVPNAYLAARARLEAELRASGLPAVIVRPAMISGNDREELRRGERVAAVVGDAALAVVAVLGGRKIRDRYGSIDAADLAYGLAEVGLGATAGCVEVHNDALRPPRSRQKP